LALHARLRDGAPTLTPARLPRTHWPRARGSGMIFNAGHGGVVGLQGTNRFRPYRPGKAIEPVAQGLGGSGGELLGGLWSAGERGCAAHRGTAYGANWLGVAIGAAGVLSVVPALRDLAYGFGLLADRVVRVAGHRLVAHDFTTAAIRQ